MYTSTPIYSCKKIYKYIQHFYIIYCFTRKTRLHFWWGCRGVRLSQKEKTAFDGEATVLELKLVWSNPFIAITPRLTWTVHDNTC